MDAGIIAATKVRYECLQMLRALDLVHRKVKDIWKVDNLIAMYFFKSIWNNSSSELIKDCWAHAKLWLNRLLKEVLCELKWHLMKKEHVYNRKFLSKYPRETV